MKTVLVTATLLLAGLAAAPTASAAKYGCDGTTFLDTVVCLPEGAVEPLLLCYGTVEDVASCIVSGELANLQRFHERLCWHLDNCSIG